LTVLEGRQSGELLDREEFRKLVELVESRGFNSERQSSGKYKSIKAEPNEFLQCPVPHLAFFKEV
jgi:hypothetical protein